jgi:hypothetical protein
MVARDIMAAEHRAGAAGCYLTPRAARLSATVGQQERDAV